MKLKLKLDAGKCSACAACAIACMDQNDIDVLNGVIPFRMVFDIESDGKFIYMSMSCMHCDDAPCVLGCPAGCLSKDESTGLTIYDNMNCIGCHSCAMACPYGAPSFSIDGKMIKCDGCIIRHKHGMLPACVKNCPTYALTLVDEDTGEVMI